MTTLIAKILTHKITILLIAGLSLAFAIKTIYNQKQEMERLEENFFTEKMELNRTLNLTEKEFKKIVDKDREIMQILEDSLDIKRRQIKNLKEVSNHVTIRFKTELRDTTIYERDTVYVGRTFTYRDPWNDVEGLILRDTVDLSIQSMDSLYIVHHAYKKGKWFLPRWFSKTYFKTEVTNRNPNHDYVIIEDIQVLD